VIFDALVLLAGTIAGAVAAVSGFGIGSLLTPVLATHYGTKVAVAAVSIPHVIGTAVRFVKLREHVDRRAFIRFGILSAAGGLLGALIHARVNAPVLSIVLGVLLIFAGVSGLLGLTQRVHLGRRTAWAAGMLSGLFGGLVGNQGGIRSAALMGFDLSKESFVATATAVALVVDGARMPVYVWTEGRSLTPAVAGDRDGHGGRPARYGSRRSRAETDPGAGLPPLGLDPHHRPRRVHAPAPVTASLDRDQVLPPRARTRERREGDATFHTPRTLSPERPARRSP